MAERSAHQVTADHLRRDAYLYVRQSTYRQVSQNQESTRRQYALRDRALALGWPAERIVVIDSDLGHSGASAVGRPGFQRLVADVGMGRAGMILGLEVSRLARSSSDWSRLLEICAMTDTLLLDEDGIYDPGNFNDRLLLGLKGTMSEAELHFLQARMRGGLLNKARRGELRTALPVGFVYAPDGRVVLDPDQEVQQALRHLFATFQRTGSADGTVRALRKENVLLPKRVAGGPHRGELTWRPPGHSFVLGVLHNPRYAGAFFFGRKRFHRTPTGVRYTHLPRQQWTALFPDAHPGYISWTEYESIEARLAANAAAPLNTQRSSPPREGPALLQGIVVCGRCGARMTTHYQGAQRLPTYICDLEHSTHGGKVCQCIRGSDIDAAVGALVIESFTPLTLEVALSVQQELESRAAEVDRLRRQHVERARYAAELAQRRYMSVDPANRLVAAELELEWNARLADLHAAEDQYEQQSRADRLSLGEEQKAQVLALATDFPRLWNDPRTAARDRKRLLRLLVEDVTLIRGEEIAVHVRFRGGAVRSLGIPLPPRVYDLHRTPAQVVRTIDQLLDEHMERDVAQLLNAQGLVPGCGGSFTTVKVRRIANDYGLATHHDRLRARGLLTIREFAARVGIGEGTVRRWCHQGVIRSRICDAKGTFLLEPPDQVAPGPSSTGARAITVPAQHSH